MLSLDRWQTFSVRDQLGHIGSELVRAQYAIEPSQRTTMLERALALIDLSLEDPKWRDNPLVLLALRGEGAKVYVGHGQDIAQIYALL